MKEYNRIYGYYPGDALIDTQGAQQESSHDEAEFFDHLVTLKSLSLKQYNLFIKECNDKLSNDRPKTLTACCSEKNPCNVWPPYLENTCLNYNSREGKDLYVPDTQEALNNCCWASNPCRINLTHLRPICHQFLTNEIPALSGDGRKLHFEHQMASRFPPTSKSTEQS